MTDAPGTDGVQTIGGYLGDSGERNAALRGSSKWITYDNLIAMLPGVAAAVRAWEILASSVKWRAEANPRGGANAEAAAQLIQEGLLDARMPSMWRTEVVPRQLIGAAAKGFAIHAKGTRIDSMGRIVYADLAHRPQWTVERWEKPDETQPWTAITQRGRTGGTYRIERGELFYSASRVLGDSPDGVGLFRHIVESERYRTRFQQLLGIAFDTDINGVPIGRAPLHELALEAVRVGKIAPSDSASIAAYVASKTEELRDLMEQRTVRSDRSLLLDSATYETIEPDKTRTPSTVYKWSVDTFKTTLGAIADLRRERDALDRECLRVFFAEWLAMGDGEGARAVHADKTSMMGLAINGWLDRIAVDADRDLVRPLIALNGYDPETEAPSLYHEPVATRSALEAAQMLAELAKAALADDDAAADVIRAREELPPRPKATGKAPGADAKRRPTDGTTLPDPGMETS